MRRITFYDFGKIRINGEEYSRDLIITPGKIIGNWWRREGHYLRLEDILDYINPDEIEYDAVIIGTGYYGNMRVDKKVIEYFKGRGKGIIISNSQRAVEEYNRLVDKGGRVIAMFHLTC
jgi:hypothetical protein